MFTAIALVTLAIGIGANTAVFSVVNGVLIKPLPYPGADELIGVWHTAPGVGIKMAQISPSMFFTYRDENRAFRDFGAWSSGAVTITGLAEPEQVRASLSPTEYSRLSGSSRSLDDRFPETTIRRDRPRR